MHRSGNRVSFWSAVAIGIGSMVGAGIFALLGQAGAKAALIWTAALANAAAIGLCGYHLAGVSPMLLFWIACFLAVAFAVEFILHHLTARNLVPRQPD